MLPVSSARARRLSALALLVCLPLALTACDSADDPIDDEFSETVNDIRVEFRFDEPADLTGPLTASGDNVLSRLQRDLPGNSTITGVRITRVKVDLLRPLPPTADIGDLNRVEFYLVNGTSRQLVASGEGFTVGSMQSETTLTIRKQRSGEPGQQRPPRRSRHQRRPQRGVPRRDRVRRRRLVQLGACPIHERPGCLAVARTLYVGTLYVGTLYVGADRFRRRPRRRSRRGRRAEA